MRAARQAVQRAVGFLREVRAELRKVVWPTWRETVVFTGVVLLSVAVVALMLWIFDATFSGLFRLLLPS